MSDIILSDWLTEQEVPFAGQAPATDPAPGMDQMAPPMDPNAPVTDPNVAGPPPGVDAPPQEVEAGGADLEPVAPDMPEEKDAGMAMPPAEVRETEDGHYGVYVQTHHNKSHPKDQSM